MVLSFLRRDLALQPPATQATGQHEVGRPVATLATRHTPIAHHRHLLGYAGTAAAASSTHTSCTRTTSVACSCLHLPTRFCQVKRPCTLTRSAALSRLQASALRPKLV